MNRKQKIVLLLAISAVILTALYPPWCVYNRNTGKRIYGLGYAFIFNPPGTEKQEPYAVIDYTRLAFQWSLIVILTAGFLLVMTGKREPKI